MEISPETTLATLPSNSSSSIDLFQTFQDISSSGNFNKVRVFLALIAIKHLVDTGNFVIVHDSFSLRELLLDFENGFHLHLDLEQALTDSDWNALTLFASEIFFSNRQSYLRNSTDLGTLYESIVHLTATSLKNIEGIQYTPRTLVEFIVNKALRDLLQGKSPHQIRSISILDPSCGAGIFLIDAFRKLLSSVQESTNNKTALRTVLTHEEKISFLIKCIYGVDKDKDAIWCTKLGLMLSILENEIRPLNKNRITELKLPDLSRNIQHGNALVSPDQIFIDRYDPVIKDLICPFSWEMAFPHIVNDGGFSCILGNPPYGLSRDEQISLIENSILKAIYSKFRTGKVNKYILFMAKGYQLLGAHGVMSYVVPNAWLGIKGGSAIRELFLRDRVLAEIDIFDELVFDGPIVESVVFKVQKGKPSESIQVSRYLSPEDNAPKARFILPSITCLAEHDSIIPTNWAQDIAAVLVKIRKDCLTIGDPASPFVARIALQAYAVGKGSPPQTNDDVKSHVFHSESKLDDSFIPYLDGADVDRYSISWSGKYLRHGPWLAEPQTLDRFTCPRLLIREIIGSSPYLLIGAFTKDLFTYNKSVLHIISKEGCTEEELLALLGILNSKIASFIIRYLGKKSQRRIFPKIVNDDLRLFPIPRTLKLNSGGISSLVRMCLNNSIATEDLTELQTQIDKLVYSLYGLNEEDVTIIESSLR